MKDRLPLVHYLYFGRKKGLTPNPLFIGEYYDKYRWQQSIIDPLVKYILRKKTWHQATSPLFDGSEYESNSLFRPPLASFLRALRRDGDSVLYVDRSLGIEINAKWSQLSPAIYESVDERAHQYKVRSQAEPTASFDEQKQQQTIQKYANYFGSKKEPLVSVVTPAWNRQDLVGRAIESVQAQNYKNWELLVVDDGSTDDTIAVVKEYAERDSRIKLFTPGHGGVCRARNHGVEQAMGKWVAFLDSDNTWTPNFLSTAVAMLDDEDAKAGYGAIEMNNRGNIRYRVTEPDPSLLETGNYIDLNAMLVQKSVLKKIGNFDESLRRMVDYDLAIRISNAVEFIYIPVVGVRYTDHDDSARISTTESLSWDGVVKNNNFIRWDEVGKNRDKDKVSIIVPVRGAIAPAVLCIDSVLKNLDDEDVEVVVADASSNSALNIAMSQVSALDKRLKYIREPATRDAVLVTNYAFAKTTGSIVIVVNQHVKVEAGWLGPLIKAVDKEIIAGPLQLQPSRTVRSAGVEFHGFEATPINLLEDHPVSDIAPLDNTYEVDGLMNGCVAVDAQLFAKLRGLNPLYDGGFELQDLSLRARGIGAKTVIAKQSQVVNPDGGRGWYAAGQKQYLADWQDKVDSKQSEIWQQAGFSVLRYEQLDSDMGEQSRLRPILEVTNKEPGKYRWAIKISSPADERRHVWGDTHYAKALAKSLEKLGQRVAIDYHDYHDRPTSYLDDILLDLRGLDDPQPQQDALNIMWVISHPEKLTPEIVNKFDIVFAAGKKWAEYMSEKSNKTVHYLPQCTDPEVFHPNEPDPKYAGRVIFVGNSRNVLRPIVRDAIAAGIDFDVYGGGWEGLIDIKYIKGQFIPNDRLTHAYSSASVVLNDHWGDMREWGFISNRIFDALASGSPVVSDEVYGLEETLKDAPIFIYSTPSELEGAITSAASTTATAQSKVQYIRENHSFDARAEEFVSRVDDFRDRK